MESRSNCCICNELKPNEMFSSTQRAKNALRRMCKDCDARVGKDALPILVPETLPLRLLAFVSKPPRWQMSLLLHIFETVPLKGALRFGPACHIFWDLTSRDNPDLDSAVLAPYIVQHTTNRDATWQNLHLVAWGGRQVVFALHFLPTRGSYGTRTALFCLTLTLVCGRRWRARAG